MSLTDIPIELVEYIAEFILPDIKPLVRFAATCQYTYASVHHFLYRSITCHTDQAGALCSRTLASSTELCQLVRSFTLYGPDHLYGEDRREFIRDLAKALNHMANLTSLNCDVSYCSLEVCISLSTGKFEQLESLALRITDHSVPISRSVHRLGDLGPYLPSLTRLIIRDNTQPSHARSFIEHFISSRRNALKELMLSCWYDNGAKFIQRPSDTTCWLSLRSLIIRRDAFNLQAMSLLPHLERLTLLRDLKPMPPLPISILPNLQYIACATFNLASFLPKCRIGDGRPIKSVKLDGISAVGTYHGPRNQPTRTSLRNALSMLAFSSERIQDIALPVRMLYAAYFRDVAPYLSEVKSLVVHIVVRASVHTGEVWLRLL